MITLAIIAIWIICGVFAYGITFAYFQGEFPDIFDERRTVIVTACLGTFLAILGPGGLLVSFLMSGFAQHGLKWR